MFQQFYQILQHLLVQVVDERYVFNRRRVNDSNLVLLNPFEIVEKLANKKLLSIKSDQIGHMHHTHG